MTVDTVVSYALGTPRAAAASGGACRGRDLAQARNIYGSHRFAATTDLRISNGLLRLTVGATGIAPTVTVAARRGPVVVGDTYATNYPAVDVYGGSLSAAAWQSMGVLTFDSPDVTALLVGAELVRVEIERHVIVRLIAPAIGDVFLVLRLNERHVRIQHGTNQRPSTPVTTSRRTQWTASPSPAGTTSPGRVEETLPAIDGFPRFLGTHDAATANAGAFTLTTAPTLTAHFGAGIGTAADGDTPADLHGQLRDSSVPFLAVG